MPARRLLLASALLLACSVLPTNRAHSQQPKKGDELPLPRLTADAKTVEELKTALAELKAKTEADAKKTAEKIDEAVKTAIKKAADEKAATEKKAADDKAAADKKAADEAKASGADKKAEEEAKAAAAAKEATEKSIAEIPTIKAEVFDDDGNSKVADGATTGRKRGDSAWVLTASAFVLFMVPGLALFYGGMVRRKNVLATMMQSMAALAVVGVFWIAIGYSLAFGPSALKLDIMGVENGGLFGWSWDLFFLQNVEATTYLGQYDIPVYLHVMFQGMFAIITPALISGAIAERIRFWPFCLFMIMWVTFVYCPLAHMVWAFDWFDNSVVLANRGKTPIGLLGKMGALDFAGGTVVHIAAGMAGLACCLVIGKRAGYPKMIAHPNSMVLTLLGAGLLWFGWFGFNGGSALNSGYQAVSAFAATQAAAAAAGLGWMLVEWIHKGKPTALGLASGIVAGLVAVTPASGYVYMWAGIFIGLAAAVLCYLAVALKNKLGYDDSLDAFGVHAVGGIVGAILTGVFCTTAIYPAGGDGYFAFKAHRSRLEELRKDDGQLIKDAEAKAAAAAKAAEEADAKAKAASDEDKADAEKAATEAKEIATDTAGTVAGLKAELKTLSNLAKTQDDTDNNGKNKKTATSQVYIQIKAVIFSVIFAFVISLGLCALTQAMTLGNFRTNAKGESDGLDRTEHDEVGFDFSGATESVAVVSSEPRAALKPPNGHRFDVQLSGVEAGEMMKAWTALCQPSEGPADADFLAVYPYVTTIRGTTFRLRGGDPETITKRLAALFKKQLGKDVKATKVA